MTNDPQFLKDLAFLFGYMDRQAVPIAKAALLAGARVLAKEQKVAAKQSIQSQLPASLEGRKQQRVLTGAMIRSINARAAKVNGKVVGAKAGVDVGSRDINKKTGATKLSRDGNRGSHGHLYLGGTVKRQTGSVRIRVRGKTVGRRPTGNPVQNRGISPPHVPGFVRQAASSAAAQVDAAIKAKLIAGFDKALSGVL